ncbi:hypothetical protein N180_15565 [Pedobacter antarcticus 4BY]|uniref:Rad50/SbcC-type AAA domain-containing protein n=2 Tax=Pedobacter antarcticus TaxID=34086 RepID=A0A081PLT1_9SPHI|nr:AAA family ATPase [Pedobacter antarcticus]KEQ31654.1 hypothetical protein N180_15565 [Pedobacter antarcticus 4BY]SFE33809.1 DNA repair exonuclease SbcCD ATPase subunit [Pedobacter antarcticus]
MAKIKQVTIENFRAYEGIHEFSFVMSKGLANLVVVYAPNGYGKTSFFDAIEWTFSNKIRRFENGVLKQELESKDFASDDQIVLTNRTAYFKGEKGEVTILTDEDKVIKRTVVPRQIPNTEIKSDYREVALLGDYRAEEIKQFSEYNMLTQDQIDSFLRFKSPEEKFEALREFWPEGSEASSVFATLTNYARVLRIKNTELQHAVNDLSSKIAKNINSEINFSKVNNWIRILREQATVSISLPDITSEINDEVYRGIIQANETYKLIVDSQIATANSSEVKHRNVISSWEEYIAWKSSIDRYEKELGIIQSTLAKYERIKIVRDNNEVRTLSIKKLSTEKSEWDKLDFLWVEFEQDLKTISTLQSLSFDLIKALEEQTDNKNLIEQNLANVNEDRRVSLAELEAEQVISSKIEVGLRQIEKLKIDISDGHSHQMYTELCINDLIFQCRPLYEEKRLVEELLNHFDFSEYDSGNIELNFYISKFTSRTSDLAIIKEHLSGLEQDMENRGSFNENLSRMIKWAEIQIDEQHISSCPMCNTKFDDLETLLSALKNDKGDVLSISKLELELEAHYLIKSYIEEEIEDSDRYLLSYFETRLDVLGNEIENLEIGVGKLEQISRTTQDSIDHAGIVIDQIFEELNRNSEFSNYIDIDFNAIRTNNQESVKSLRQLIKSLDEDLTIKNSELKNLNNSLIVSKTSVENNENRINLTKAKNNYIETSQLIEKLGLNLEVLDQASIKAQCDEYLKLISSERLTLAEQNIVISTLMDDLGKISPPLTELDAKSKALEIESILTGLKQLKLTFESNYATLVNGEQVSIELLQSAFDNILARQKQLGKLKADLDAFGIDLAIIESDVERNRLNAVLLEVKSEKVRVENACGRIEKARSTTGEYITKGIDEYFNKDVINQIYGKIEPHPKLTEIEIRADSTGRQPRLMIRAKSDSEELAPGLFLSTGQVNVLSLSIFIARAYEMGSGNFNSIFMDDPVQNMSDINVLSFVDLLRILIMDQDRQVMISTHDEKFFKLLQHKLSDDFFKSKFIELSSYGKIKDE